MNNKVILVTGASSGIGRVCADALQKAGWIVIGASRRGTSNGLWSGITMDVDSDDSVQQGIASVMEKFGRLDAVLTCAGWGLAGAAEQTPIELAKAQVETNFWGSVRIIQAVLPHFRAQGAGRIILMSSIGGLIGIPYQSFYSASKFALEGYAEALGYEVEPFGIHVTLIEPGNFKTDFTASRRIVEVSGEDPYKYARTRAIEVMERDELNGADPDEVSKLVKYVLTLSNPPRRTSVGKTAERIGLLAKRILPFSLFEKSARASLGV